MDGNFLAAIGFDPQLLTAGSCGGLVKAIFDKSKIFDSVTTMIAGALTANYLASPFTKIASSGAIFNFKIEINQGVAGFLVGTSAIFLLGWLTARLRSKLNGETK